MFRRNRSRLPSGLVLVTRHRCPLCDQAVRAIDAVGTGGPVELRDVESDPELARFQERVPVLLDSRGAVLAEGRITERSLRAAASSLRTRRA